MTLRSELGEMMSLICFKAALVGVEDTLGEDGAAVVFIRAGKVRGNTVAREANLVGTKAPIETMAKALDAVLGKNGTRLCRVVGANMHGHQIIIDCLETVCSANEELGSSRKCTFTLGAIWGALESVMDQRYLGEHTDCVLRGGTTDRFVFTPIL